MKNPNSPFGYLLILAGIILLLYNFDLISFSIHELIRFWPSLLVYSGIVLLVGNKKGWAVTMVMLIITLLFVVLYYFFRDNPIPAFDI